jgi:hypothetical protein
MIMTAAIYLSVMGIGGISGSSMACAWGVGTGHAGLIAQEQTETARSSVGTVGKRQVRASTAGINPLARVNSRITNRIRFRIQNRIDPSYSPTADAAAGIDAAVDRARNTTGPR